MPGGGSSVCLASAAALPLLPLLPALLQVVSPFQDGILSDWEVAEGLLQHALK
jgi:hypothetical protein